MIKAVCPTCAKVVAVAGESSPLAGRLSRHRRADGAGMCPAGGTHRARARDLVHGCKDCRALPGGDLPTGPEHDDGPCALEYRPALPRPVAGRGRCATHLRAKLAAEKVRNRDRRREDVYGITAQEFAQLWAAQGHACACGKRLSRAAKAPSTDHDHARARACATAGRHDRDRACRRCVRGVLCHDCNVVLVGRFSPDALDAVANYKRQPTAQRLGWWDETEEEGA